MASKFRKILHFTCFVNGLRLLPQLSLRKDKRSVGLLMIRCSSRIVSHRTETARFIGPERFLTRILLTWTIWRASNNASKWRIGFNSAFKGLKNCLTYVSFSRRGLFNESGSRATQIQYAFNKRNEQSTLLKKDVYLFNIQQLH